MANKSTLENLVIQIDDIKQKLTSQEYLSLMKTAVKIAKVCPVRTEILFCPIHPNEELHEDIIRPCYICNYRTQCYQCNRLHNHPELPCVVCGVQSRRMCGLDNIICDLTHIGHEYFCVCQMRLCRDKKCFIQHSKQCHFLRRPKPARINRTLSEDDTGIIFTDYDEYYL